VLKVEGIFTEYPNERGQIVKAAQDVSFAVPQGQLFTLLGPSGCGKTTTLRSIAGLERPRAGEISVNDRVVYSASRNVFIAPNRRGFGMVFQSYAIWPHMNVFQNAAFPLEVGDRRLSRKVIRDKVERVVKAAKERRTPIRIGVNAGSLERELLEKYGYPTAEAMVESALGHIRILEDLDFSDIKVSLKASHVGLAVAAYRAFSAVSDYPLHLGITEAGTAFSGGIKSAVGLGILLAEGIGDTIRVSLAADPVEEVKTGFEVLKALDLRRRGVNVVACPTCGRLEIDVIRMANEVERRLAHLKEPLTVSILGCVVNGIGEGKEADIGIAGGRGVGLLFKHGEIVRKVPETELMDVLLKEIDLMLAERGEPQPAQLSVL